jgi:hypothetical protein
MEYYLSVSYRYDENLLSEFSYKSEYPAQGFFSINGTAGKKGEYGVKSGKTYMWDLEHLISDCCRDNRTISEQFYLEIISIGRYLGSDFIDYVYDERSYDSCNTDPEDWDGIYTSIVATNWLNDMSSRRNFHGNANRVYISPENPQTFLYIDEDVYQGWLVILTNTIENFSAYITDSTDVNRFTKLEEELVWKYDWNSANMSHILRYEFDKNGILVNYQYSVECGDYLSITTITLQKSSIWLIIVIMLSVIAGVSSIVFIVMRKRRNTLPESSPNSFGTKSDTESDNNLIN